MWIVIQEILTMNEIYKEVDLKDVFIPKLEEMTNSKKEAKLAWKALDPTLDELIDYTLGTY
jgi:hypothetical protein